MVIHVGAGLVVVPFKFGTYFEACFRCNGFGHFARSCPTLSKQDSLKKADESIKAASSWETYTDDKYKEKVYKQEEGLAGSSKGYTVGRTRDMTIETLARSNSQTKPSTYFSFSASPMKKKYSIVEPKFALTPVTGRGSVKGDSSTASLSLKKFKSMARSGNSKFDKPPDKLRDQIPLFNSFNALNEGFLEGDPCDSTSKELKHGNECMVEEVIPLSSQC